MRNFILMVLLVATLGCDVDEVSESTEYIINNNSIHSIDFTAYFNSENSSESTITSFKLETGEEERIIRYPESWTGPLELSPFVSADSLVIIFNDTLYIKFDKGKVDGNPMLIDNFELLEGTKDPYQYIFNITQQDFDRAVEKGNIL